MRRDQDIVSFVRQELRKGTSHREIQRLAREGGANVGLATISRIRAKMSDFPSPDDSKQLSNWREGIEVCKAGQAFGNKYKISEYEAKVHLKSDEPVIFGSLGDLHLGSHGVDYDKFLDDYEVVLSDHRIKLMIGNDMLNNFQWDFKNKLAVHSDVLSIQHQKFVAEEIIKELDAQQKIIAYVEGNHDQFGQRNSGDNIMHYLHRGPKNYVYMEDGGLLKLTVGKVEYKILTRHKYRGTSTRHKLASNKSMMDYLYPTADITFQGDKHDPAMEIEYRYDHDLSGMKIHMRNGTYKIDDSYSRKGFKEGLTSVAVVVLFPDTKKMVPFLSPDSLRDAIAYVNGISK